MFSSYEMFNDWTRKMWPFNTSDCLIEVNSWADLTVLQNTRFIAILLLLGTHFFFS